MKEFFRKKGWNLLIIVFAVLLIIPQTRMSIQVFAQRLISFSPSEISKEERASLTDYNFELKSLEGVSLNLRASKGKVVLINFWATWCPPCVAEMPSLQALYDAYGDTVDFYFVTDEEVEKVASFVEKNTYTFPVQVHSGKLPSFFNVSSIPRTFLFTKNGEVAVDETGAVDWNSKEMHAILEKLLQE